MIKEAFFNSPLTEFFKIDFSTAIIIYLIEDLCEVIDFACPFLQNMSYLLELIKRKHLIIVLIKLRIEFIILEVLLQSQEKTSELMNL